MNEMNNRVCCLYRVSTDKQVDFNSNHEADLPMQRKACHKFAEAKSCRSSQRSSLKPPSVSVKIVLTVQHKNPNIAFR